MAQLVIRNNVLRGLHLKRNKKSWEPLWQGVMPILSLQKCSAQPLEKLPGFSSNEYLLAGTWLNQFYTFQRYKNKPKQTNRKNKPWWFCHLKNEGGWNKVNNESQSETWQSSSLNQRLLKHMLKHKHNTSGWSMWRNKFVIKMISPPIFFSIISMVS